MSQGPEYHSIQIIKMILVVAVLVTISIGFAVGFVVSKFW